MLSGNHAALHVHANHFSSKQYAHTYTYTYTHACIIVCGIICVYLYQRLSNIYDMIIYKFLEIFSILGFSFPQSHDTTDQPRCQLDAANLCASLLHQFATYSYAVCSFARFLLFWNFSSLDIVKLTHLNLRFSPKDQSSCVRKEERKKSSVDHIAEHAAVETRQSFMTGKKCK